MNEVLHPDFYRISEILAVTRAGDLVNKVFRRPFGAVGAVAGSPSRTGYLNIMVGRRAYRAHRVVWLLTHGHWPQYEIDHIDGNKLNNAPANLRDVPKYVNLQNRHRLNANNKSGFAGVSFNPRQGWHAQAQVDKVKHHLGFFNTAEEASAAFEKFRQSEYRGHTPKVASVSL